MQRKENFVEDAGIWKTILLPILGEISTLPDHNVPPCRGLLQQNSLLDHNN